MAEPREEGETRPRNPEVAAIENRLIAGREFAGHRIEVEIGRGGMGIVYRARHIALDRERALKVIVPSLSDDPGFRERFQRESQLVASARDSGGLNGAPLDITRGNLRVVANSG